MQRARVVRFRGERVDLRPGRYALLGRWYGGSSPPIVIIAVINEEDGAPVDWAAYIGGGWSMTREGTIADVAEWGSKLDQDDACFLFPDVAAAVEYRV